MKSLTDIFISHPSPCNKNQIGFLKSIDEKLLTNHLNPVNLGKNNWNYKKPLEPIKNIINGCSGAIIVGLERFHCYIGYDKENAEKKSEVKEIFHKYSTSPWVQIEAGMAYQAGLPLLVLKEKKIHPEGILDPNNSNFYIFEFEIEKNHKSLSKELHLIIESWISELSL